jgi:hypothetical protein
MNHFLVHGEEHRDFSKFMTIPNAEEERNCYLVRDVCHGHVRYVARVVMLGEGTRQSHKGNAQALGRRSDGAANGTPHRSPLLLHISQQITEWVGGKMNK